MRAGWFVSGLVALASVGGCFADVPAVAPRCPAGHADAPPGPPLSPESLVATLLKDAPDRMLLRADADAAIVDLDGLLFVLPASETRGTKEALDAALAPLSAEVRAATWDRLAVVVWLGRGHGRLADPAPRLPWDPALRLDLVHDDLTDTGCLVRAAAPRVPGHSLLRGDALRLNERAQRTEAKLLEALGRVEAPLPAEALARRAVHDWRLLALSGVWAQRLRKVPIAAVVLILALLIFFGLSLDKESSASELEAETLQRRGALIVPVPPGEGYRVISYGLLHGGLNHVVNNCFALYIGAFLLEPALGPARTVLVFLAGVLVAGVVRRLWQKPGKLVGASGGTFALKGAAIALALLPAAWMPPLMRTEFTILLGVMLALGLLLSFLPGISLLCHLAGAVAGALLALTGVITLARPPLDGAAESAIAGGVTGAIALLALAVWLASGLWARSRPG